MINSTRPQARVDLFILALTALVFALWLFYIDEGKYNFDGIFRPDTFFFLLVYVAAFLGFELLIQNGLREFVFRGKSRKIISAVLAAISLALPLILFLWR
jgi:hypothetical protein